MNELSPPLQAVLELFQGPLANVRFAEIDAQGLAAIAAEVESAGAAVTQQEAQLATLRQTLAERQDTLLLLAQRALAYARVYAEQDDALTQQLACISLPRAAKPRKTSAAKPNEATATATATAGAEAREATEARDATDGQPTSADQLNSTDGSATIAEGHSHRRRRPTAAYSQK